MGAERFDEAATIYAELVRAVPGEPGLRLNLGMALAMAGRPREAVPHLEAALTGRPDLLPAALFLGAVHMELGQPARAVEPLETFLAAQPAHTDARQMLGEALLALERHDSAARQFRVLVEQAPKDPRAWFGLGRSYEGLSQSAFQELQVSAPESAFILLLVAEGMEAQERDKSAFVLYREALDKRPGLAEAREALARIYERAGHPEWAAAEREKARGLPPLECRSASMECDFRASRYQAVLDASRSLQTAESRYWQSRAAGELAREAFARLDALGPSPEGTLIRVQILRAQRRYGESKETLEKAVEAWPEDLRLRQELASLLFIAREYEAARPVLEGLLKGDPGSPDLNLLLGELWLAQRQPEKAVPYLEKAVAGDGKRLRARAFLGRAYLDAGQAERAVPHLEAALETDEDGSLHFQLARAYQATGQADRARQTRQEFLEIQRANAAREEGEQEEFSITPP
jgi:predicted Zn-dependent protease